MPINPNRLSYTKPIAFQLAKLLAQSAIGTGTALAAGKIAMRKVPVKRGTYKTKKRTRAATTIAKRVRGSQGRTAASNRAFEKSYFKKKPRTIKGRRTSQLAKQRKRYPQKLTQIYSLCSASCFEDLTSSNDGIPTGTIKNKDDIYSIPSVGFTNSSCVLLNIANTESHWYQGRSASSTGPGGTTVYRTGTQLCGEASGIPGVPNSGTTVNENDSFLWKTGAANVSLVSQQCPMFQTGVAENAIDYVHQAHAGTLSPLFIVPNSTLDYLKINITVFNPQINPQTFNIKVVRANTKESIETATFGDTSSKAQSNLKIMLNSQKFTNSQQYSTLYSKTFKMHGLRVGQKIKYHKINKALSLKYLRTQYRKKFSAEDMDTFGEQASSTFSYEPGFFNSVYVILSSTLTDEKYVSNVSVNRYVESSPTPDPATDPMLGQEHIPQLALNINSGNSPGVSGASAGFPQTTMGGRYLPPPVGAMFGIRGTSTVKVIHSVEAIRRSVPLHTSSQLKTLQEQIDELTSQVGALAADHEEDIGELKDDHTDHLHEVEHPNGNWTAMTSTPV